MTQVQDRLIVALDTDAENARQLVRELSGTVRWLKVGMTLFYEAGPAFVRELRGQGFEVFLDLKLHDIPHQVRGAAHTLARLGVQMLTIHAVGGLEMMRAAIEGAAAGAAEAGVTRPAVVAVTVLTSMSGDDLASVGVSALPGEQVSRLGGLARDAGVDGLVCSPREAAEVRSLLGRDALVVTPGVRPADSSADDQTRVATPRDALSAGASHLVVGRPITAASDPAEAARQILAEMEETQ